jgi:hypothetical protein
MTCDDIGHQFPEEETPEGMLLLGPCLLCGIAAADAMNLASKIMEYPMWQIVEWLEKAKALGFDLSKGSELENCTVGELKQLVEAEHPQ